MTCNRMAIVLGVGLAGALALAACGGGGGSAPEGEVAISLADAPADDIAVFECEVLSIELTRSDGLKVDALPTRHRVDFADLVSVAQLATVGRVPAGTYTDVSLTLNLVNAPGSNPAATATDPDGVVARLVNATDQALVLDTNGTEFTGPVTLDVKLDPQTPLVIVPGSPRLLALDFDLDSSTIVDAGANTIRVLPILKAEVDVAPRPIRIRGPLLGTNAADESFTLALRPHPSVTPFGSIRVSTTAGTYYEVDGQAATGTAGFALLAAKPQGTAVVAHGTFDVQARRFVADSVEAGSSVHGGTLDLVAGLVTARSGDTLTVRGIAFQRSPASVSYNATISVETGASTKVARRLHGNLTPAAIAVGQAVICAGTLSGQTMGSVATPAPFIRMVPTPVCGDVAGAPSGGQMTVDVDRIGRLPTSAFTGLAANPWTVHLGSLNVTAGSGATVLMSGFVLPATADFAALSVADISNLSYVLVRWRPPGANKVTASSQNGMTFDISSPGGPKISGTGCSTPTDLGSAVTSLEIRKTQAPAGLYVVRIFAGPTLVFTSFGDWVNAINARLATKRIIQVSAQGTRTLGSSSVEFDSDAAAVTLE